MLNCAEVDFSTAEDITGGELAPHGTVVLLGVKEVSQIKANTNNKKYFRVIFEVLEGPYVGKEIGENYYVEGKDFALQKTMILVRYVLENTIEAHLKGTKEAYKIASYKTLETGKVVAKLKVKGFFGEKDGKWIFANEIDSLATPREDSSSFKVWKAWKEGQQPWQSDFLPPEPQRGPQAGGTGNYGSSAEGPPASAYDGYGY